MNDMPPADVAFGIFFSLIWGLILLTCYEMGKRRNIPLLGFLLGMFLNVGGLLILALIPLPAARVGD